MHGIVTGTRLNLTEQEVMDMKPKPSGLLHDQYHIPIDLIYLIFNL